MMKRLFGRSPNPVASPTFDRVDKDAHGCPACPHPALVFENADDDGASTLLPSHHTDLDGRTFEFATEIQDFTLDSDGDVGDIALD